MQIYSVLNRPQIAAAFFIITLSFVSPLYAGGAIVALDEGESIDEKRTGWLPYLFATDALGTAIGAGGFTAGTLQPQASLFGTGFVTSNDSALISGALNNFRLGDSRFFTDTFLLLDHFTDQRFYADLDLDPSVAKAGSNDSDPDDFVSGTSNEVTFEFTVNYALPIGNAKDDPISVYRLKHGLLKSGPVGGSEWNPMTSGKTTLATRFFYTYRDLSKFNSNEDDQLEAKTNGLDFRIEYDNTDFPRNPSYGSRQQFKVSRDFGWFDSSNSWTNLQLDMAKYFNLGTSDWFRQQVLALDFWTSSTPTWKTSPDNPQQVTHRPPPSYGSELGGFDRMRAYPSGRFRDKSAVYYAAELRLMPDYQPLHDLPVIKYFEIDWWQIVPFVEVGRVGPEYNSDLFFDNLKVDAGISLRLMAFRAVVRLDWAVSEEGNSVWAMISQPFSRSGN
ncbi:MAG: BamA/TamA family outer membrane protein [Pseudomonadota bacterium]